MGRDHTVGRKRPAQDLAGPGIGEGALQLPKCSLQTHRGQGTAPPLHRSGRNLRLRVAGQTRLWGLLSDGPILGSACGGMLGAVGQRFQPPFPPIFIRPGLLVIVAAFEV